MKSIQLSTGRWIGEDQPPYVVAEAGINHNGDIEIAKKLIYEAARAGADAIKFQKRTVDEMYTKKFLDQPYNKSYAFGKTYGEHKKYLEFTDEQYFELKALAESLKIDFLCSGFDRTSFEFIETQLNVPIHKIASPFVTDYPLLKQIALYGKPMIFSTGMHDFNEIRAAVEYMKQFNNQIIVLQATTLYPCPTEEVNLRVVDTFRRELNTLVGYSSHDKGVVLPAVAIAFGACLIEKHFTLDRTMIGPDHIASVEPRGLELICKYCKTAQLSLGNGIKTMHKSETAARIKYGVSITSCKNIAAGEMFTANNIMVKCPGGGISPTLFDEIIGKRAAHDIAADTTLYDGDVI